MKTWTRAELDEPIFCPKQVVDPPRKEMRSERGHRRNDMTLCSPDSARQFSVVMCMSERFPENFSFGLVYNPRDEAGELTLLRCNGPHGEHDNSPMEDPQPHFGYYIHRVRADAINAGLASQKFAELTDGYASFPEALHHFLGLANIVGAEAYFPQGRQVSLFPPEVG